MTIPFRPVARSASGSTAARRRTWRAAAAVAAALAAAAARARRARPARDRWLEREALPPRLPWRLRRPRPVKMRAAEPSFPRARRGGGLSVEVRAPRTWPAGGGMAKMAGSVGGTSNDTVGSTANGIRSHSDYPGAATTAFRGCVSGKTRPRPPEPRRPEPRRPEPRRRKRATRRAGPRPAAAEGAGREGCPSLRKRPSLSSPGSRACGRPGTMRRSRMRPSPQGRRRRRRGAPFAAHRRLSEGDGHDELFPLLHYPPAGMCPSAGAAAVAAAVRGGVVLRGKMRAGG